MERKPFELFDKQYLGGIGVDLSLTVQNETYLSDLTARIYLRDIGNKEMAFVLEDINVL
ncbi:MAG TPA: hypothetical protein VGC97_25020 [Pyrinomonadaceae bacterium]|jgi:hypothetical protein